MTVEDDRYYILNRNDGVDTLHDPERLTEECNTDQIEGRKRLDPWTAEAMVTDGSARACGHCKPDPQG